MTLIEGVGDEVVQFVVVVLIILVAAIAWWSTNANPDRYRTVLVMRSRAHHPVTVSIRTSEFLGFNTIRIFNYHCDSLAQLGYLGRSGNNNYFIFIYNVGTYESL